MSVLKITDNGGKCDNGREIEIMPYQTDKKKL